MCLYFLIHDNFVDKEPSDIVVKGAEPDIHSEVPNNIEEIATDIPPEVKESEESEVMESGELIHGINCVCKLYMGTCIGNIVNDSKEDENENNTEDYSV